MRLLRRLCLKEICSKAFYDDFFPKYDSPDGRVPYNSWGNGSAMRVSAVGWFFDTLEETERVAKISAEITHNHPEEMILETKRVFSQIFHKILDAMKINTAYGKQNK